VVRTDALGDLENLLLVCESEFARKRGFAVSFEERAVPTVSQHEAHVDAMFPGALARRTKMFAGTVRRRESIAAKRANLSRSPPIGEF
jgi:hypothetical protein